MTTETKTKDDEIATLKGAIDRGNDLLAAMERQRNEALNALANSQAQFAALMRDAQGLATENAKLSEEIERLKDEIAKPLAHHPVKEKAA